MDDGADDFYRGLISASAFVARMSESMSQRRDRHQWKAPAQKFILVPDLPPPHIDYQRSNIPIHWTAEAHFTGAGNLGTAAFTTISPSSSSPN